MSAPQTDQFPRYRPTGPAAPDTAPCLIPAPRAGSGPLVSLLATPAYGVSVPATDGLALPATDGLVLPATDGVPLPASDGSAPARRRGGRHAATAHADGSAPRMALSVAVVLLLLSAAVVLACPGITRPTPPLASAALSSATSP